MEFQTFTLKNGIRVIHQYTTTSEVSHCGMFIHVGSRDENEDQQGMAHLIEHTIFKGTTKRKAFHILNRLDSVGGELNAFTTKEVTCVHASFLSNFYERAIELIGDIIFNSTFPIKQVEKEKNVIVDEINSYLDSPDEQIFDDFEEQVFKGHSIGRNILGTAQTLEEIDREALIDFYRSHYTPDKMVFCSVGNITSTKLKKWLEKHLADYQSATSNQNHYPFTEYTPNHQVNELSVYQAHWMMGNIAYPMNHPNRRGLILLNNVLGGPGLNSRLNLNIREKYGLAYQIDSSYIPYSDTGLFNIYLGTDKKHLNRAEKLVKQELKKLRTKKLGALQLSASKHQLIGQIALARESHLSNMLSLGKSLLFFDHVDAMEKVKKDIMEISAMDLMEIANEVFQEDQLSQLTYLPG